MESEIPLEVVDAVTKITLQDGKSFLLQMNPSLIDPCPDQRESLLQPHQSRAHGVLIDDFPLQHRQIDGSCGSQCVQVLDTVLPLTFDGLKCLFQIQKPTSDNISELPRLKLSSPMP